MIKLLGDRVLLTRYAPVETLPSGLHVPALAQKASQKAVVEMVGTGYKLKNGGRRPLMVRPGDTVAFGKYAGVELHIDGQDYLILREKEIFCVIDYA